MPYFAGFNPTRADAALYRVMFLKKAAVNFREVSGYRIELPPFLGVKDLGLA